MLKKDFLEFLHKDWMAIAAELQSELNEPSADQPAQAERLRKADQWIAHYAKQLKELYGVRP